MIERFKIDQSTIRTAKEIRQENQQRLDYLIEQWKGVSQKNIDEFLDPEKIITPQIIRFVFSYWGDMEEIKQLKKTIRNLSFKIREFYHVKTNHSAKWDEKFDKAKATDIRFVVTALTGESNLRKNISCPFHDDKGPSMKIYDESFYCFSCVKGGSVIDFVMQYFDFDFKKAVNYLSDNF